MKTVDAIIIKRFVQSYSISIPQNESIVINTKKNNLFFAALQHISRKNQNYSKMDKIRKQEYIL